MVTNATNSTDVFAVARRQKVARYFPEALSHVIEAYIREKSEQDDVDNRVVPLIELIAVCLSTWRNEPYNSARFA